MIINWFMVGVAVLQVGASGHSFYHGSWRLGVMNFCLAIANAAICTTVKP